MHKGENVQQRSRCRHHDKPSSLAASLRTPSDCLPASRGVIIVITVPHVARLLSNYLTASLPRNLTHICMLRHKSGVLSEMLSSSGLPGLCLGSCNPLRLGINLYWPRCSYAACDRRKCVWECVRVRVCKPGQQFTHLSACECCWLPAIVSVAAAYCFHIYLQFKCSASIVFHLSLSFNWANKRFIA